MAKRLQRPTLAEAEALLADIEHVLSYMHMHEITNRVGKHFGSPRFIHSHKAEKYLRGVHMTVLDRARDLRRDEEKRGRSEGQAVDAADASP